VAACRIHQASFSRPVALVLVLRYNCHATRKLFTLITILYSFSIPDIINRPIHQFIRPPVLYPTASPRIHLFIPLIFICLLVHSPFHLATHLLTYLPNYLPTNLSVYPFTCLFNFMLTYLLIYLHMYLPMYPPTYQHNYILAYLTIFYLHTYLLRARGRVVIKALYYKPEGRWFDTL
jgi:hypothetical protein